MIRLRRPIDWDTYLCGFHDQRPAVTEGVLTRCTDEGTNPYEWVLEGVGRADRVLDLACGNAPTYRSGAKLWAGVDRSGAELAAARARGARPARGRGRRSTPAPRASFDVVVCAMALMLVVPPDPHVRAR